MLFEGEKKKKKKEKNNISKDGNGITEFRELCVSLATRLLPNIIFPRQSFFRWKGALRVCRDNRLSLDDVARELLRIARERVREK